MNIEKRLQECEQKFNTKQTEREQYIRQADECMVEMNKLQGEWGLLRELAVDKEVNKRATTIKAVPEKSK